MNEKTRTVCVLSIVEPWCIYGVDVKLILIQFDSTICTLHQLLFICCTCVVFARFRCKLCHYSNPSTFVMKTHMRLHKTKRPFECSLCAFMAESSEDLQNHMIQHCKVRQSMLILARLFEEHGELLQYPRRERLRERLRKRENVKVFGASNVEACHSFNIILGC